MSNPLATHIHTPSHTAVATAFLNRTGNELREMGIVRVWEDKLRVIDFKGDYSEITGIGYADAEPLIV